MCALIGLRSVKPHHTSGRPGNGTSLDAEGLARLLRAAYDDAGIQRRARAGGVEIVTRRRADDRFSVIINHTDEGAVVDADGDDLLTGMPVAGAIEVAAGGVAVVRSRGASAPTS